MAFVTPVVEHWLKRKIYLGDESFIFNGITQTVLKNKVE